MTGRAVRAKAMRSQGVETRQVLRSRCRHPQCLDHLCSHLRPARRRCVGRRTHGATDGAPASHGSAARVSHRPSPERRHLEEPARRFGRRHDPGWISCLSHERSPVTERCSRSARRRKLAILHTFGTAPDLAREDLDVAVDGRPRRRRLRRRRLFRSMDTAVGRLWRDRWRIRSAHAGRADVVVRAPVEVQAHGSRHHRDARAAVVVLPQSASAQADRRPVVDVVHLGPSAVDCAGTGWTRTASASPTTRGTVSSSAPGSGPRRGWRSPVCGSTAPIPPRSGHRCGRPDGSLLARGTFADRSDNGWQDMSFSKPSDPARQTYIASYFTPATKYAFQYGYFSG